jgi:hypothetical protein
MMDKLEDIHVFDIPDDILEDVRLRVLLSPTKLEYFNTRIQQLSEEDIEYWSSSNRVTNWLEDLGTLAWGGNWFTDSHGYRISTTDLLTNDFHVHLDDHIEGDLQAVMWVSGNTDCGGDMRIYHYGEDPNNEDAKFTDFPFQPGKVFLWNVKCWHRLTQYTGRLPRYAVTMSYLPR